MRWIAGYSEQIASAGKAKEEVARYCAYTVVVRKARTVPELATADPKSCVQLQLLQQRLWQSESRQWNQFARLDRRDL